MSVPAVVVVRGCVQLQWIFFEDSTPLPISWWVIYECTCPHRTEYSAVFGPKRHDSYAPPSLFTQSSSDRLFVCLFPQMKQSLKGKHVADVEEVKQKNGKSTKRHQNRQVQRLFWVVGKRLDLCIVLNGEYPEGGWRLNINNLYDKEPTLQKIILFFSGLPLCHPLQSYQFTANFFDCISLLPCFPFYFEASSRSVTSLCVNISVYISHMWGLLKVSTI